MSNTTEVEPDSAAPKSSQISSQDEERYSRQLLIDDWDQSKIANAHVVIVGAGALGSVVGIALASMGVGHLTLIDFDTIELSNLNRQLLFRDPDIGKSKAEVAARELQKLNPTIKVDYYHSKMEKVPLAVYKSADVLIGCLDTFRARRWLNSLAIRLEKPLVLGGMFAWLGNVQVIQPYQTACFECQPLVPTDKLSQACTPLGAERKEEYEQLEIQKEEPPMPSVSTVSFIIGGYMAQEATKLLLRTERVINNYLFIDLKSVVHTELELARNEMCPVCGEKYKAEAVEFVVDPQERFEEFKQRVSWAYGLADPTILISGKIVTDDTVYQQLVREESGKTIFISDQRLARPIKIKMKRLELSSPPASSQEENTS